jgi:hypothetical protein
MKDLLSHRNIETHSHDYATVDEAVFSPCRDESHIASYRLASSRLVCCQATAINTWMTQEWGGVTWPRQQWCHAFQQWRNNWSTIERSISCMSDQGFIGETGARSSVSSWWETTMEGSQLEKIWSCELKTLNVTGRLSSGVIFGLIWSASSCVFNCVTRRGLVCVTVNHKV